MNKAILSCVALWLGCLAMPVMADSAITFMREEHGKWEEPANHVLDNRFERRNYSLLVVARDTLGPQAMQPQCADTLSPTQRKLIAQLAAVPDTVLTAKLTHEILLHQTALQEMHYCVLAATRSTAKR